MRDRPEVQLKAIAYGALDKRRENWGYNRKWLGNYLALQVRLTTLASNIPTPIKVKCNSAKKGV